MIASNVWLGTDSRSAAVCLIQSRLRLLAPQPRPATDTEPRLQRLVLLPVLQRCPDEQATDESGGQDDEQDKNDRSGTVHMSKAFPPTWISSPTKLLRMSSFFWG